MSNTHAHDPWWAGWECVYCGATPNNDPCSGYHEGQWYPGRYTNGKRETSSRWEIHYTDCGHCRSMGSPPTDYVRYFHKANRQHVRMALKELEGDVDWEAVNNFDEPVNKHSDTSAIWNW